MQVSGREWTLGSGEPGLVSIIIPTYQRLNDLLKAVASALEQTHSPVEVIVVADGPDADVRAALAGMDPRLTYIELAGNSGPAAARNAGVLASRGEWLTFLDDDDTVLPHKVSDCFAMADSTRPRRMIACRTIYRRDGKDDVWPTHPIRPGEDVADYILVRHTPLGRPGVLPIQALMVHRSVLEEVPFTTHKDHEDWAWLLDAWHIAGARVEFCWEPLVVYNIVTGGISRSRRMNWQDSLEWADTYRHWMSRRAYNSFLCTKVALKAKRAGDWRGLRLIAGKVLRNHPRPLDLMFLWGMVLLPGMVVHAAWRRSLGSGEAAAEQAASQGDH
jgi:glycosyltransferase involved in cell wall biosynthesis